MAQPALDAPQDDQEHETHEEQEDAFAAAGEVLEVQNPFAGLERHAPDSKRCILGWTCANGIDPCVEGPCEKDCPPGQLCGPDQLCWPETTPPTCTAQQCSDLPFDCTCKWSCSNGNDYAIHCSKNSATTQCDCLQNDQVVDGCQWSSSDGGSSSVCIGDSCCKILPK